MTILAFSVLSNAVGHAEALRLDLTGPCPNHDTLTSAFVRLGIATVAEADVHAEITSSEGRASLRLSDASNESLVSRQVKSRDCAAIAEVFALVVFDALSLRIPDLAPVLPSVPAQQKGAAATTVALTEPEQAAQLVPTAPGVTTKAKFVVLAPAMSSANKGTTRTPKDPSIRRPYAIGLSRGYRDTSLSVASQAFYQADLRVDMGVYWMRSLLAVDGEATSLGIGLSQQQYSARADVGLTFRDSKLWIRPGAGLGIVLSSFSSTANDTHDFIRLHPVLAASLMPGMDVSQSISLHLLFEGFLYPVTDRYLTETMVLGESTRANFGVSLGAQWRFGL